MMDTVELELLPIESTVELTITDKPDLSLYASESSDGATLELTIGGPQGMQGVKGDTGAGFPIGGAERQILRKKTAADFDTEWAAEDFSQQFTNQDNLLISHNLGRQPAVHITDSTGAEIEGMVTHLNNNQLSVVFSASFTGAIVCS